MSPMIPMHHRRPSATRRGGFTLVEMLVSTALVMLIMVLFSQIYAAAVSSMRDQEGTSKNDQKARSVDIVLQSDLKNRTFRGIPANRYPRRVGPLGLVPLRANFPVTPYQSGYFAVSENDPGNDGDDVLSFTIFAPDGEVFYGPCASGSDDNHPDADDGVKSDERTASRAAEIVYFLRDGILYRRMNLLRDPLACTNANGQPQRLPTQPSSGTLGVGPVLWTTEPANWKQKCTLASSSVGTFTVLGVDSLPNSFGFANYPLGLPQIRYGHNSTTGNPDEEYSGTTFQGRKTLKEWSFDGTTSPLGSRDILLSNVTAFDIKVWEPQDADGNGIQTTGEFATSKGLGGRFVDIGHGESGQGIFAQSNSHANWGRQNTTYGPSGSTNKNLFDTWHPQRTDTPPFAPLKVTTGANVRTVWRSGQSWTANSDWTTSDILFPRGALGDYSYGYRVITSGTTGVFPPGGGEWTYQPGKIVQDNTLQWECFDNRIGLTMIRISIRYRDPGSELIRQVTIDHSFVD